MASRAMAIRAAVGRAITIRGTQQKLAHKAGCSQHAIWRAKEHGRVSADLAIKIEKATGGRVTRFELCPLLAVPVVRSGASERRASAA